MSGTEGLSDQSVIDLVQVDLPNFPAEVILIWLKQYVESNGWPPGPNNSKDTENRWKYLLGDYSILDLANLQWLLEEKEITFDSFEPKTQISINEMIDGYVNDKINLYTTLITDGKDRFLGLLGISLKQALGLCR